jgi:hypothetical protein
MSPFHAVDREGIAPSFPACGAGVVLLDQQPEERKKAKVKRKKEDNMLSARRAAFLFTFSFLLLP